MEGVNFRLSPQDGVSDLGCGVGSGLPQREEELDSLEEFGMGETRM